MQFVIVIHVVVVWHLKCLISKRGKNAAENTMHLSQLLECHSSHSKRGVTGYCGIAGDNANEGLHWAVEIVLFLVGKLTEYEGETFGHWFMKCLCTGLFKGQITNKDWTIVTSLGECIPAAYS